MILFLVAVKSLIPVRGVLRADKGGKREHWKQAMDCRDELKLLYSLRLLCLATDRLVTCFSSMQPLWCQLILFCPFLTSLYLKHVLQKPVCSPWNMSDYITNLETNSTYWPVAQKNKDYFICVPEIRLYIFLLLINKKLDAKPLNCRLT